MNKTPETTVTVNLNRLIQLIINSETLEQMESNGVDNWVGMQDITHISQREIDFVLKHLQK